MKVTTQASTGATIYETPCGCQYAFMSIANLHMAQCPQCQATLPARAPTLEQRVEALEVEVKRLLSELLR